MQSEDPNGIILFLGLPGDGMGEIAVVKLLVQCPAHACRETLPGINLIDAYDLVATSSAYKDNKIKRMRPDK